MGPITARVNKTTMASMGRQPCGRPLMKKKQTYKFKRSN